MSTCPVCEHQQAAGSECEVCGRPLVAGRGTDAPVAPLEGLEPTGLGTGPDTPLDPVPGLEPTRLEGWAEAATEAVPDLVATATAPVQVTAEVMADLEPTFAPPIDDGPATVPAVVTCRYCRTEAAPGERRCGRCGMRLPVPFSPAATAPTAARAMCSCGTPVTRAVCPACGARNAVA